MNFVSPNPNVYCGLGLLGDDEYLEIREIHDI
jgi:hypothetical protein